MDLRASSPAVHTPPLAVVTAALHNASCYLIRSGTILKVAIRECGLNAVVYWEPVRRMARNNHIGAQGAYGDRLGTAFRLKDPPTLVSQTLRKSKLAVTRLRSDCSNHGLTAPIRREDAYLVTVQLRDCPEHELWVDGKPVPVPPFAKGDTLIHDLKRDPIAGMTSPFDALHYYLPRAVLNEMADELSAPRIDDLQYAPGAPFRDDVLHHLTLALLPALENPDYASSLFVDYIALAFRAHVAHTYGGIRQPAKPNRGGLAPWQERRAKEIIMAELDRDVSLDRLAAECQLSRTHFARAFRQTTGMPPHRWLLARRVDKAKDLLSQSPTALADIALACGFADQSHFTKVFTRMVGTSPGAWRRENLQNTAPGDGRSRHAGPPDATDDPLQYLIAHGMRKWGRGA